MRPPEFRLTALMFVAERYANYLFFPGEGVSTNSMERNSTEGWVFQNRRWPLWLLPSFYLHKFENVPLVGHMCHERSLPTAILPRITGRSLLASHLLGINQEPKFEGSPLDKGKPRAIGGRKATGPG